MSIVGEQTQPESRQNLCISHGKKGWRVLASCCLMGGPRNTEVWENYWGYQKLVSSCCEVLPGREDTMDKHDSPNATRLEKGHLVLRAALKL